MFGDTDIIDHADGSYLGENRGPGVAFLSFGAVPELLILRRKFFGDLG